MESPHYLGKSGVTRLKFKRRQP